MTLRPSATAAGAALVLALAVTALSLFVVRAGDGAEDEPNAPDKMAVHDGPRAVPEISFENGRGEPLTLANFRGKVVALNLWATWCPPCREEMPTLDALQDDLGGDDFEVVALSVDRAGPETVREFYSDHEIDNLALYVDSTMGVLADLGIPGIPTTLIIDRRGREIARLTGEADWATPEMLTYFRGLVGDDPKDLAGRPQ